MFHIAICEHEAEERRRLAALAHRYLAVRPGLHGRVCLFRTGRELLAAGREFSVCILDAELEGGDGFEIGRGLKERCPQTELLFFSGLRSPARALEAYRLCAVQYLSAPAEERMLFDALDRALARQGGAQARRIALNSTVGLVNLLVSDIVYAKSSGHRVSFFLRDGGRLDSKCLRVSFGSLMEPLLENGFLRCHDSYVVNLSYVVQLTAEGILLADGKTVPVSTKKRTLVREILKNCGP